MHCGREFPRLVALRAATGDIRSMDLRIETELEEDGRWIAEVPQLPGVLAYGATADEAAARAEALALRVLADRLDHGETKPLEINISLSTA